MGKIGIIRFPGASDAELVRRAIVRNLGREAEILSHLREDVDDYDAVILPGGVSYGQTIRPGAIAAQTPVVRTLRVAAATGKPILGFGEGFHILCEAKILPGTFLPNRGGLFYCSRVPLRVINPMAPFTSFGRETLELPIACSHGTYWAEEEILRDMESDERILFRFAKGEGPPGAEGGVAGVSDHRGRVMGLLAQPERAMDERAGPPDGILLFRTLLEFLDG